MREMRNQKEAALDERATALEEEDLVLQQNHDLLEEEAILKKSLKSTEKERDIAREELQVLGDEKRVLKQELEEAFQEGINAEREKRKFYITKTKDDGKQNNINWNMIDMSSSFNPITRNCRICLKEKKEILYNKNER